MRMERFGSENDNYKPQMLKSVRRKVSWALYAFLVWASCALVTYLAYASLVVSIEMGQELAVGRAKVIAAQVGPVIKTIDGNLLQSFYTGMVEEAREKGLVGLEPIGLSAYNADGHLVVEAGETVRLDEFYAEADALVARSAQSASVQHTRVGDYLLVAAPVADGDGAGVNGMVVAAWSQAQVRSDVLHSLLPYVLKAFVGALAAIFLAILLVRSLALSPLARLCMAVRQVHAGEDGGSIPLRLLKRRDEIGKLAACYQDLFVAPKHYVEHVTKVGEQLNAALENMSQGLCMFDARHQLVLRNGRFLEIYGLSDEVVPLGMHLWDFMEACKVAGNYTEEQLVEIEAGLARQLRTLEPLAYIETLKNGQSVAVARVPMADGGWVTTFEDITERKQAEARIEHMALHDALTGLANRVFFRQQLEAALSQISRRQQIGVFLLDLDRFKAVNDTLGHPVGDELLRAVAIRLRSCVRRTAVVARLGGDEFAIVETELTSASEAENLANRIITELSRPYEIDSHHVVIGTSVGIAIAPIDGTVADTLVKAADLALYHAKADGRGTCRFFERDMDSHMQERRMLELELRKALLDEEFEVHYQPLVNLQTDAVSGFEALIRWRHPIRGLVLPKDFIPLSEEIGLIGQIGTWVLNEACRAAAQWPDTVRVAVNLSPIQFRSPGLVAEVRSALDDSGLAPQRLELEITEAFLLQHNALTLSTLQELHDLGVRISMDDFGTGYSSLGYLRNFVFDKIKIDQSFVKDLVHHRDALAIVRAILRLGTTLGISTTAEGVETLGQLVRLRLEGCTEVQGYYISPPVPEVDISQVLDGRGRGHVPIARLQHV